MNSLLDKINEVVSRTNNVCRKKWTYDKTTYTSGKWVDVFEINGRGVVDFLRLYCDTYTSQCTFRITFDDVVWERNCNTGRDLYIYGENMIFGATYTDSYYRLVAPMEQGDNVSYGAIQNVRMLCSDFEENDFSMYNILPGGIRFNEHFKISVNLDNSYPVKISALYGLY